MQCAVEAGAERSFDLGIVIDSAVNVCQESACEMVRHGRPT